MNTETLINELNARCHAAFQARDMDEYDFCRHLRYRLEQLSAVAEAAAAVYQDHSVDSVWETLYERLWDADMVPEPVEV